jgi:hypothetical protein
VIVSTLGMIYNQGDVDPKEIRESANPGDTPLGKTIRQEWKDEISQHLETAHLILLLISADFLASDYCYDIEMRRALERNERGEAAVIPIILRKVDNWESAPFSKLQCLPKDGKPITSWTDRDEAWADVARGIRLAIRRLHDHAHVPQVFSSLFPRVPATQNRVLDAGIPARIAVGRAAQLVAMIRRVESDGLRAVLELDDLFSLKPEAVKSKPFQVWFLQPRFSWISNRGCRRSGYAPQMATRGVRISTEGFTPGDLVVNLEGMETCIAALGPSLRMQRLPICNFRPAPRCWCQYPCI